MNTTSTLSITLPQMLKAQEQTVEEINEKMRAVHGPGWDARHDYSKTLITIASAVFGAVIAFSEKVFGGSGQVDRWLIIAALALFIFSIACSLGVIYQRAGLTGFHARYFNQRDEIRGKSEQVNLSQPDAYDKLMAIFKEATDIALEPVGRSDKLAHWISIASGVTFLLALCLFLVAIILRYGC